MIASLRGQVLSIALDHAVIDCSGVGYLFLATPGTLSQLRRGDEHTVLTHLAVKEDSMTLYGFISDDERRLFLLLQTVSGLGPKLALATVGTLGTGEISAAIAGSDAKKLQTVPGVGKRMADRMILDLKDKVTAYLPQSAPEVSPLPLAASATAEQVTEALIGLGFTERVAGPVVDGILAGDPDLSVAAALKASLAELGRG